MLTLHLMPYANKLDNYMSLFNEMMVSCYLYVLYTLTDFHAVVNPLRDQSGTGLTVIILFTVSVNVLKFFIIKIIAIY